MLDKELVNIFVPSASYALLYTNFQHMFIYALGYRSECI